MTEACLVNNLFANNFMSLSLLLDNSWKFSSFYCFSHYFNCLSSYVANEPFNTLSVLNVFERES